ncbi:DUF397 domain-containing protein [Streptomyces sp. NPDC005562]|uniref:DUF397 domain-containing protein n=1 Tax=Streptomyces sp. NPDC005562 TaxID=3154890 RepID=UPI0033B28C4E
MATSPEHKTDLYSRPIEGTFSFLCNGNGTEENMESCLTLAQLQGGGYAIQGNKPEDAGRELRGTSAELLSFAQHIVNTVKPDTSG